MIRNALVIAVRQMLRSPARSGLTSLGILIGVAAVIAMVSIGEGARARIQGDLASLGGNLLFVIPGQPGGPGGRGNAALFSEADARAVAEQVPGVLAVAPSSSAPAIATRQDERWSTTLHGVTNDYLTTGAWTLDSGRAFTEGEQRSGASVCILGQTVVEEIFGAQSPLDQRLRLGAVDCQVIGVLAPKGENTFGADQDDAVLLPLRAFQRRVAGTDDVAILFVSAKEGADTAAVKGDIEALMRDRRHVHGGAEDDFTVRDMAEMASMLDGITGTLTSFLAAIAAVSLLVGGIGIMNIMLVSVTERTREIGIRLAVGALARDVLLQFLVEAMVLSATGGALGVALGVALSWAVTGWLEVPLEVNPAVVLLAVGFSALMGVGFGFFPAQRAAKLDPIDALRHE
ncbi:MAG: ABC transporter permease [Alphaproteobacteria bacterium]|nr:ABC transporter permease [Alphaproteobacteria bacterium]MCB9797365.1 ABC transporter permease [Alphaproteobacteria bacterium]